LAAPLVLFCRASEGAPITFLITQNGEELRKICKSVGWGGYVYPICFDMFWNPCCKKPKKGCSCTGLRNMSKHVLTQQEMYLIRLGKELPLL
jgi:hypothetical protein